MNRPRNSQRRLLVNLILILTLVQIGILVYLRSLLRPSTAQEAAAEPTAVEYQPPTRPPTSEPQPAPTQAPAPAEVAVVVPVLATNYATQALTFDEEQALEHLARLASDDMGGRQPGTPGGWAAGDYIAAKFAEYGLQPAGIQATYFQTFTVPYGRIIDPPVLAITPPRGYALTRTHAYRTDYRALTGGYVGAGTGQGPVVWLSECLHDDYAGLDMVGKIAMCRYSGDPRIYRQAIEHRVGGLLLLDREGEVSTYRRPGYRETAWVPQTIPAFLISDTVALDLVVGTRYTLDDLSLRFSTTPLSTTATIAVVTEEQEEVEARNVLGLLPGSHPAHSDEIVVIGAHYDHLGREPDGEIMRGANDNASGVATILEIARLWQAQGYRPARSVLFAAWDAEEIGLLGSQHYVRHPTLPLTRTAAYLNLDMVGAGEELHIDGGRGTVVAQLEASAEIYGITTTVTFQGRSDHIPFYETGVPAASLAWWPDAVYHTPDDRVEALPPNKLKAAGVLSSHALAALAKGHVELEQAVEQIRASILAGDREAFLASTDPNDPDLRASQAAWFDNLWSRDLVQIAVDADQVRIGDGEADVTLTTAYRWADAARPVRSISYDVRFIKRGDTWHFAGYELDELPGDVVTVARFPDVPVQASRLLSTTQQAYVSLVDDLGLEPVTGTRFIYYPDAPTLRAIARPAVDQATLWLAPSAGLAEIAWGQPITPALIHLALNQMGLPPDAGDWLREGLMLHYEEGSDEEYLPILAVPESATAGEATLAEGTLTSLLDFPDLDGLEAAEAQAARGYAWSATEYLLDHYGTEGLRALCASWGRSNDLGRAVQEALDVSLDQFESAWRDERIAPLRADARAIQATIAARVEAVLAGDEAGFLATVNPANSTLGAEERSWFADVSAHPVETYAATGGLVGWSAGGHEAIVALNVSATIPNRRARQVTYDARFVRQGTRWLYDGAAWTEQSSEHFILKYDASDHDDAWARLVLDLAEEAYAQITADLDTVPPSPQEIKVYDDGALFRSSVSPSLPDWTDGWTKPDEAIKCCLRDADAAVEHTLLRTIARELTHQVLSAQGVETDWLREGVASFEAGRVAPLGSHWVAGEYVPLVQEAVRRHTELPLYRLPSLDDVPDDQAELLQAQSWSLVSFIAERFGLPGLRRVIAQSAASGLADDTADNLQTTLGVDAEAFQAEWREQVYAAGVPDDLAALAQRFDPERALADIDILSSPEYGGREAGTPGAELTAAYIAEQFATLGLEPMGDPLAPTGTMTEALTMTTKLTSTVTGTVTETVTGTVAGTTAITETGRGYLQQFPISHTHLISVPALTLLDDEGTVLHEFVYHDDFVERAGEGLAQGELVWLRGGDLEGLHFGGAVVLQREIDGSAAYGAQLQARGAGGLIVTNGRDSDGLQRTSVRSMSGSGSEVTIPVFEITHAAFESLLERVRTSERELIAFRSPALPLEIQMRQTLARPPVTKTQTANVLAMLPGSDPDLADEVLLIGAHYDHIGGSPDGLYFPGANQNASGVSTLLEMARVWQATGYRPARSVLFAAWGAQELNGTGVTHYLADPAVPLTRTVGEPRIVGVIALDSVGGGDGYRLMFHGTKEHDLPIIHRAEASAAELSRRAWREGNTGDGWHEPFNQAGIPTIKFIWDDAEEEFYLLTDTADAIDIDRLATSGEILTLTASWLGGR